MRICLLCRDPDVDLLCRKVLEGCIPGGVEFRPHSGNAADSGVDLYVVECASPDDIPPSFRLEDLRKTVLIVAPEDLPAVRGRLFHQAMPIIVKPVTRAGIENAVKSLLEGKAPDYVRETLHAERDDIFQYLLRASFRLEASDQERANFVARATHELQGPLTSISGYCGLLLDGQLGPLSAEQREVIERMRTSVGRASRLTSAMFHLGVDRSSQYRPNLQHGEILTCIEKAVNEVAPVCQERRIAVDLHLQPALHNLYFERQQLEHAFANLLDNSCKYAPRGGFIQIRGYSYFWERRGPAESQPSGGLDRRRSGSRQFNSYRVDISDNGPGISRDRIETLFEEYAAYSNADDRSGAGLGLAVCKLILSRHNGRIWAESEGTGVRFSVVLPYGVPESEDHKNHQQSDLHLRGTL